MLANPGIRPTAEVVAIVTPSSRRSQVVGILKQEVSGPALALTPCDPRMPKMMVKIDSLPAELKDQLLVCLVQDSEPAGSWMDALTSMFGMLLFAVLLCVQFAKLNNQLLVSLCITCSA